MLIGRYYHTLETKNRVSLPKNFRQVSEQWVLSPGLDGCLFIFPQAAYQLYLDQLVTGSLTDLRRRDLIRVLTNDATVVSPDKLGRISLPDHLTQYANLTKQVVFVGSYRYLELWDVSTYHEYRDNQPQPAQLVDELT